jgi:hypothetical protein
MVVIAYPDNFDEMINLAIRLDDSFRRLEHAQEKPGIREFVGTRQQIADVIALCPLEEQEQEHIY